MLDIRYNKAIRLFARLLVVPFGVVAAYIRFVYHSLDFSD